MLNYNISVDSESVSTPNSIPELIDLTSQRYPHQIALQTDDKENISYTYAELTLAVKKASQYLKKWGVKPGMRIVLLSENRPELIVAYLAILTCEAIAVILDTNLEITDYEWLIDNASPTLFLVSQKLMPKVVGIQNYPMLDIQNDFSSINDVTMIPWVATTNADIATILYTSGTTGTFKGVMLSHHNLLSAIESARQVSNAKSTDSLVCILPLYHIFGLVCSLLTPLSLGAKVIFVEKLQGDMILNAMRSNHCTLLLGVPRLLELFAAGIHRQVNEKNKLVRLLFFFSYRLTHIIHHMTGRHIGRFLFRSIHKVFGGKLRLIVSGGAALDMRILSELETFGFKILEGYGLTETSSLIACNTTIQSRSGTVGFPVKDTEIQLHNPNIRGEGEIIVRGPGVMPGYFQNHAANQLVLRNGWFHTGDLGRFDQDGYLVITGRIKEIIVQANGEKAMPEDVERRYRKIPKIAELAIVGMPSRHCYGEEIHAAIVTTPDAQTSEAHHTIKKLIQERAKQVPASLRIQECHFVKELPKTSTLKVKRKLLVKQLLSLMEHDKTSDHEVNDITNDEVTLAIYEIISKTLRTFSNPSTMQLKPELTLEFDLGLDSLHRIELVQSIQKHFNITFPDQQLAVLNNTIQDLIQAVKRMQDQSSIDQIPENEETSFVGIKRTPLNQLVQKTFFYLVKKVFRYYFKLKSSGQSNLPKSTPYIICANHTSHLDSLSIAAASALPLDDLVFMAARDYHFKKRFQSKIMQYILNAIPFERNAEISGMFQGIKICQQFSKQGKKIIIFPEATRSLHGGLQKFKSAVAMIAYELNLPIVPAYIRGAYQCLPKGRSFPKKGKISVSFGQPLFMKDYQAHNNKLPKYQVYKMILQDLQLAIEQLM